MYEGQSGIGQILERVRQAQDPLDPLSLRGHFNIINHINLFVFAEHSRLVENMSKNALM